ncbi:MAG: penicillin-binding protein 2 [Gammaproteobacteria bacterium]|nr:penicillin-binding protein 2 [Gammaproteobacteria bacterium]MDA7989610.1 penicillin-binding protein 2 [Gammaproteobacteria bacterium]MDA8010727.1 penicillin-binding protein 2 [Gammaproteobacteria bacterium]MDA8014301.1 penicillin-binding protein 2 [Gammaproteobacteria bacterium]
MLAAFSGGARGSAQNKGRVVRRRILLAGGLVALLSALLIGRLAHIQIIQHQRFATLAQNNRINLMPLEPVRGIIYDRNGVILAENFDVYNLALQPSQIADMEKMLAQLGEWVELSEHDLRSFHERLRRRPPFEWQTLRVNLSEEEAARIAINRHLLPGVELRARLQRRYPHGDLTAHVLGYVDRINSDDLEKVDALTYRGLDYIGRSGIEAWYEPLLLGKPGVRQLEINAHGRAVRSVQKTAPQAGRTLHLSLDIELQRIGMEALREREGAIVAMDPNNGEVLAFAAAPSFDPNPFVSGIDEETFDALHAAEERPLFNRALAGRYSPGSTVKPFLLLAAMENEIDPDERRYCPGWFRLRDDSEDRSFRDWKREGHGPVTGHDAVVQSCDVYFYRLSQELGIDGLHAGLLRFGFGKKTGIDLPGEHAGLVPSREWKKRERGETWFPGETIITGIGQGYMQITPLQLATAAATMANRGRRVTPRLLSAVENLHTQARREIAPKFAGTDGVGAEAYRYAIKSMREVVHHYLGTAHRIARGMKYRMAGKTGTVQVVSLSQEEEEELEPEEIEKKRRDHALFIAFAPVEEPKIAVAVVIEHGISGSRAAAPVARKLIDHYLRGLSEGSGAVAGAEVSSQ